MTEVPEGWESTTLGALGKYINGRGFKSSEWAESGRPIIRIQNLTGSSGKFNYYAGAVDDRHVVRRGDLLISWAATLGVFVWDGPEAVLNQHIFKVESYIDQRFHRYLVDSVLDHLRRQSHGSGMVHITKSVFDSTPVSLPLLAEQHRIVDAIEERFTRLDVAELSLLQALRRLDTLKRTVDPWQMAGDCPVRPLGELLREPLRNGLSMKRSAEGDTRIVTLTAVTTGDFSDSNTKLALVDAAKAESLWMRTGDIFVQRSNTPELVGTTEMFQGEDRWAIFPDLLIRVRVNETVLPAYVTQVLRSGPGRRYLQSRAKGIASTMPKIDQPTIASMPIPVPPLAVQAAIVETLLQHTATVKTLEKALRVALARSKNLRRSILQHAFSGQLVPKEHAAERSADRTDSLGTSAGVGVVRRSESEGMTG